MSRLAPFILLFIAIAPLISPAEEPPRDIAAWLHFLRNPRSDLEKGALLFQTNCAACHHTTPDSGSPGPNLSALRSGITREKILKTHLIPRRPIPPGYNAILFTLNTGDTTTGIIDRESPEEVTLRTPQGFKTLKITEISSRKNLAPTLKPPGLFNTMKTTEIRDLIAWLTAPPSRQNDATEKTKSSAPPPHLEAEDLPAKITGGRTLRRIMTPFRNTHWGNNHILKWENIQPGHQLQLTFKIKEPGTYRMGGIFVRAAHYMTTSISLNDEKTPLIPALDLYHPTVVPTAEIELFHRHLPAGQHHLNFTIIGANPKKKSGGSIISIDFLTLKKTEE